MSKFSRRQTKNSHSGKTLSDKQSVMRAYNGVTKSKVVNKFTGMSAHLEWFEPVIIPGYTIIG